MKNWATPQLRHVARFAYGDSLPAEDRADGEVSVFGSNGPVGNHDRPNTRGPVIVIGRKGSHGKLQYSHQPVFAIDTTYYVDDTMTEADLRWLYYAMQTLRLHELSQDVGVPGLNREDAYRQRIPYPSLPKQRAIADFLDTETARIDTVIRKKRRLVDLLDEWLVAERSSLVLQGLDPVHGTLSSGALPKSWSVGSLGVLVMLHRGFDLPVDAREAGTVPVVSSGGISGSHSEAMCEPPGVVTGRYGTIGAVFYVDEPHWPLNTTLFVSDFRGNDPRWVYHLLSALPLDFDAEKSAVTGINRNVIGSLRAPRPPVHEQREIAACLDAFMKRRDETVALLLRQLGLLHEHRQAMITAAVTGELAVPGVAA